MKELVILDMDGTIINGQSQQIFLKYLFRRKIVGLFFYLRINLWFFIYKIGLLKNPKEVENIMNYSFSFLKGKKAAEIDFLIDDFFDKALKKFIFSEMTGIINEHISKGRELLIVSNAAEIIVKKLAEFLKIGNYMSTKLEMVGGEFTGRILGEIVYGKNKSGLVKNFMQKNNLDFENSWAYTDHISDLDLLLSTSKPYVVNPDKVLLKQAKKRNWPVLTFKK